MPDEITNMISNNKYLFLAGLLLLSVSLSPCAWAGGPDIELDSGADQYLWVDAPPTAIFTMTITDDEPLITAADDIRIIIPSAIDMVWDSTDTTATIGGAASGKVSSTVSYENSDKTLVINVTSDFASGDSITVSGLSLDIHIKGMTVKE